MKSMKIAKALALMTTALSFSAFAGGGSTGGGGSFVCKTIDPATRAEIIISAESQDIWETARKYKILTSSFDEKDLSREVIKKLSESKATRFKAEVAKALETVLKIRSEENVKLIPLGDSKHWIEMAVCAQGQPDFAAAAIYRDDELVYSKMIWTKMDNVSQAALNVHEAVYKVLRDEYGDKDSVRTRGIVGYLFSDMPYEKIEGSLPRDSFNPLSSKTYKNKFEELNVLFRKSDDLILDDFNKLKNNCHILPRPAKVIPAEIEQKNLVVKLDKEYDRKGRLLNNYVIVEGELFPFYGTVFTDPKGYTHGEAFPVAKSGNGTGEKPVMKVYLSSSITKNASWNPSRKFHYKKSAAGDVIVAEVSDNECEVSKENIFRSKCLKYREFNEVPNYNLARINKFYYCPSK